MKIHHLTPGKSYTRQYLMEIFDIESKTPNLKKVIARNLEKRGYSWAQDPDNSKNFLIVSCPTTNIELLQEALYEFYGISKGEYTQKFATFFYLMMEEENFACSGPTWQSSRMAELNQPVHVSTLTNWTKIITGRIHAMADINKRTVWLTYDNAAKGGARREILSPENEEAYKAYQTDLRALLDKGHSWTSALNTVRRKYHFYTHSSRTITNAFCAFRPDIIEEVEYIMDLCYALINEDNSTKIYTVVHGGSIKDISEILDSEEQKQSLKPKITSTIE